MTEASTAAESKIVAATGTASASTVRGNMIEKAMSDAVHAASKETEVIWARSDIGEDEKRAQIAAIMAPDALRTRMLDAKDAALKPSAGN